MFAARFDSAASSVWRGERLSYLQEEKRGKGKGVEEVWKLIIIRAPHFPA